MAEWSLRRRMMLALNLGNALISLLFAAAMILLVFWFERTLFYDHLQSDLDRFAELNQTKNSSLVQTFGADSYYKLATGDWTMLPDELRHYTAGAQEVMTAQGTFNLVVRHDPNWTYVLVQDQSAFERFELLLFAFIIILLIAIWGLGYQLSLRVVEQILSPLSRMVDGVGESRSRLQLSHNTPSGSDELASLQALLVDYAAEIETLLLREQRFTASVSHELRNPLMRIQSAAELLAEVWPDSKPPAALERINETVLQMERQLRLHLLLARNPGALSDEPNAPVSMLLERVAAHWQPEFAQRAVKLSVRFSSPPVERRLPSLLLTSALDNLIRNALEHAEGSDVALIVDQKSVCVRDFGRGFAPTLLDSVREWGLHGTGKGFGFGLAIVEQICRHQDWALQVMNAPDTGAIVKIQFTAD